MKKIIKISLLLCCFAFMFSCQKNKSKSSESETTPVQVDEKQQDVLVLKQELEIFDENYSDYVKKFYESLNKSNAFIKEGGKEEELKKEIMINFSSKPENIKIEVPENLKMQYEEQVKSLENMFSNFIVFQEELKKYIGSDAWKKDERKTIYNLNAKAEEVTLEYDRYFSKLMDELNKEN